MKRRSLVPKPCAVCGKPIEMADSRGVQTSVAGYARRKTCSRLCKARWQSHGVRGDTLQAHLSGLLDKTAGPLACWPIAERCRRFRDGDKRVEYGYFVYQNKSYVAHRAAFVLAGNALQAGQVVRHTCDNGICANPAHLLAGTVADNNADQWTHGKRSRRRMSLGLPCAGPRRGLFSDAEVGHMRREVAAGRATKSGLCRLYNVSAPTIQRALCGIGCWVGSIGDADPLPREKRGQLRQILSPDARAEMVTAVVSGRLTTKEAAAQYNVKLPTVQAWVLALAGKRSKAQLSQQGRLARARRGLGKQPQGR